MEKALELFLGVLTAMGGFVEIGELTFALNAGAKFGYHLLFVIAVGTVGIIVYCEMAGRVAAVAGQPVFNLIRERVGLSLGAVTLVAALAVNLLTCAAEIGGIALVWQLLAPIPYRAWVAVALMFLLAAVWVLPFKWIERVYGLLGLFMIVFAASLVAIHPPWDRIAGGFIPQVPSGLSTSKMSSSVEEYRRMGWLKVTLAEISCQRATFGRPSIGRRAERTRMRSPP